MSKLHQIYKKVDSNLSPSFIYGFLLGIISVVLLLASQYGYYFYLLSGTGLTIIPSYGHELYWITAVWLCLMFMWLYHNLPDEHGGLYRIFVSLMLLTFFFGIFELYWMIKWQITGSFIYGIPDLVFPTLKDVVVGYGRSLFYLAVSSMFARRFFCWSKTIFLLSVLQGLYWLILVFPALLSLLNQSWSADALSESTTFWDITMNPRGLSRYLFAPPIIHIVNSLPYVYAIKKRRTKC